MNQSFFYFSIFSKYKIQNLILILVLIQLNLSAQDGTLKFEKVDSEDGLAQGYVNFILQDSRGFMWFATPNGLNRYDGQHFKVYKKSPFEENSLNENKVLWIFEDHKGLIWIGTKQGGLNCFDPETGLFVNFKHNPNEPGSLSDNMVFGIHESPSEPGILWVGTDNGLNKMDISGYERVPSQHIQFTHFKHNSSETDTLSNNHIRPIYEDQAGQLWVGTWNGLNLFDRKTGRVKRYLFNLDDPGNLSKNHITVITGDQQNNLWIGTYGGGLIRFNTVTDHVTTYQHDPESPDSLSSMIIFSVIKDQQGDLWIGTNDGLNKLDPESNQFTRYDHDAKDQTSLSHNGVLSLFECPSGVIWAGTNTGGLNKFYPKNTRFSQINNNSNDVSLIENSVYSIHESSNEPGIMWIGTVGGYLHRFDRNNNQMNTMFSSVIHKAHSHIHLRAIYEDGDGMLWLGSTDGLTRFNPQTNGLTPYHHNPDDPLSLPDLAGITSILPHQGSADLLWIGFEAEGLCKFSKKEGTFYRYMPSTSGISNNKVTCLLPSCEGNLWVGTKSGLNYFDPNQEKWFHFYHDPKSPNSLRSDDIKSVFEDENHTLWVGTNGGALNKLSWKGAGDYGKGKPSVSHVTEADGLPCDVVYCILKDQEGWLWLSTNQGLVKFNPHTEQILHYDVSDGLLGNEFNTGACFKASNGELYFGGINGLNFFNPNDISPNPHIPPLAFTEFQVFNQIVDPSPGSLLTQPIDSTQKIVLSHRENVFSFQFAALDYMDPDKNLFAYRLEGFEDQWNEIGTRRFITFTNLKPRDYVLHLRGSNNDAMWNHEGISLQISITPPWWKTSWAVLAYLFIILLVFVFIWKYLWNRELLKNRMNLDHMKSKFFANISHEFRTPLTLILGSAKRLLSGKVENHQDLYEMQIRNGERLLKLVNELLDLSKLDADKLALRAHKGNLVQWLKVFVNMFQSLALDHQVNLSFSSSVETCDAWFDQEKCERIMENLISNAIKFTPIGGRVEVSFSSEKQAVISVKDTGCGISSEDLPHVFDRFFQVNQSYVKDQPSSGIGLALTRELTVLHYGEITVESNVGEGSTFRVHLPLGRNHLKRGEVLSEPNLSLRDPKSIDSTVQKELTENLREKVNHVEPPDVPLILIVEDNRDMRTYIREELSEDYHMIEAENGQTGYEQAAERIPDLIISDVMMPEMDGYQLCEKLKTDERTSHIPFVLLTAKSSDESKILGLQLGADDYLMKPFNPLELVVRVKNLLEQRQKLKERFGRNHQTLFDDTNLLPADQSFLIRATAVVEQHCQDPELNVAFFANEMGLSRSQLHRKLSGLLDQSASVFIRSIRLKRAATLLNKKAGSVSDIAYQVGFNSLDYFSKCFKEQFGVLPSKYGDDLGDQVR